MVAWPRIERYAEAWVTRVATNLAMDAQRRRLRSERSTVRYRPCEVEPAEVEPDDRVRLVAALQKLSQRQREVVVMRYCADMAESAVAEVLGISAGAVKQHASRGLDRLRSELVIQTASTW